MRRLNAAPEAYDTRQLKPVEIIPAARNDKDGDLVKLFHASLWAMRPMAVIIKRSYPPLDVGCWAFDVGR